MRSSQGAVLPAKGPLGLSRTRCTGTAGPRVGSVGYNLVHTYTGPLALGGVGLVTGEHLAILVAAVWATHIGVDRLFGFGLKYETGFRDTHLSTQPAPVPAFVEE